jgi:hypothetical protein
LKGTLIAQPLSTNSAIAVFTKSWFWKADLLFYDKYFIDCNFFNCYENNVTEFEIFSEQVNYFENSKLHGSFKGVKGNLKKHIQYWKDIGANEFILGTISEGYVIPFSSNPPSMCFKNNKSAFQNHDWEA